VPYGEGNSDPYLIYSSIKKGTHTFHSSLKDDKVKSLINNLLTKNPKIRALLSFDKIKESEYF
jgi:hypothetical protein